MNCANHPDRHGAFEVKGKPYCTECHAALAGAKKQCSCWNDKDTALREKFGLKISDACSMLQLDEEKLSLSGKYGLPLQRVNGNAIKRNDPCMIQISHCPFCGKKLS